MLFRLSGNELSRYSHALPCVAHTALHDRTDAELRCDFLYRFIRVRVAFDGGPRNDAEIFDL